MIPRTVSSSRSISILLLLPLMLLAFNGTALAEAIGRLTLVAGAVDIMPGGQLPAVAARQGGAVQRGDFVRTKSKARAEITFNDGSVVKIAQRSRIDVGEYSAAGRKLGLPRGKVQAVVPPAAAGSAPRSFEIRTPNAIAGVRGTSFYVYHQGNVTGVAVKEGVVHTTSLSVPSRGVTVVAGMGTTVTGRKAPTSPRPVSETELNSHQNDVAPATTEEGAAISGGEEAGEPVADTSSTTSSSDSSSSGTTSSASDTSSDSGATADADSIFAASALSEGVSTSLAPNLTAPPAQEPALAVPVTDAVQESIIHVETPTEPDPTEPDPTDPTPTEPTPTEPFFSNELPGALMSRDASIDQNSNLLTIINDPGFAATLSGTESIWTGSALATISGTYPTLPLQQPNHYWFGRFFSGDATSPATADGGAYYGYFGGMSLDGTGVFNTNLSALYLDPAGKIGIMQGRIPGTITADGVMNGTGPLILTELNATSGLDPALLTADWWNPETGSTVMEMTIPVLAASDTQVEGNRGDPSEGFLMDASLNLESEMTNRGDVLRLGALSADPSFGIWTRESFGSYSGSATNFVLISNAEWGAQSPDFGFNLENSMQIVTIGDWQSGGALTGTADGVWGELDSGSIRLLTGSLTGSSNLSTSTFGAVTTGAFIDLSRFLANPALAADLGFPTVVDADSFTLTGTNQTGSVSVVGVTFYRRAAGELTSLWVARNVSGSYAGELQQQNFSLMDGATPAESNIMGSMRITSVTPSGGSDTFLGSINGFGETGTSFRSQFDGIVAGSFNGGTFTGSAAGLSHPVTYYSTIVGGMAQLTRYASGGIASHGNIDGILGGMSLWGSTPEFPSDFQSIGFFTPNQTLIDRDFVMSAPIFSSDIPSGLAMTADGGAYRGHMVAGVSMEQGGGISGIVNAISIDPSGNAGILHGDFQGYLDPYSNLWMTDGDLVPVTLSTSSFVTASTLNDSGSLITMATPFAAAGTYFSGTPALSGWANDFYTRSYLADSPDWGIGQFGLYASYSEAPVNGTPWDVKFSIKDKDMADLELMGTMMGERWESAAGRLAAGTRAGWYDMLPLKPAENPMTGIFIGETVGTFNPGSLQAMTSGIWMETGKFLGLAATATGQAALQKLNIPAVEVGKADFSGGNGDFDVLIKDLRFFAPVSGGRPQVFATDSISGNFFVATPTGTATLNPVPGFEVATSGITPAFTMNRWDAGNSKWSGTLEFSGNSGAVAGNSNIQLMGVAAGGTSGGSAGTFTGTAAGVVR